MEDAALETLFLPVLSGELTWPAEGRVLFLRARAGPVLDEVPQADLVCLQSFKPHADALERSGLAVVRQAEGSFPLVLVLPPRQREEARALLALALLHAGPGGTVLASALNAEGARSVADDLERLAGPLRELSKHKCRAFWSLPRDRTLDQELQDAWLALDAPRPIADGRFVGRPGLFAWDRIDPGTAALAAALPPDLEGRGADLGAGIGVLAAELLARCPGVTALDLYEAEERALDLARINLADVEGERPIGFFWHDVARGLPQTYDFIVTNPPFHDTAREDRTDLGRAFIAAAANALVPRGRLWLVANRHLPYEATLRQRFATVRVAADAGGYKVIEAVKGRS
jgi:16S rRNA (guanine1207-N2)-methyltransferase